MIIFFIRKLFTPFVYFVVSSADRKRLINMLKYKSSQKKHIKGNNWIENNYNRYMINLEWF